MSSRPTTAAAIVTKLRLSAITILRWVAARAMGGLRSTRLQTANCQSPRKVITSHGRRSRRHRLLRPCRKIRQQLLSRRKYLRASDIRTQQITNRRVRMRFKVLGLAAMIGAMISAGPAMACYNGCGGGYVASGCGVTFREQLPNLDAGPQYYYVNQGPTYTGPGNIAPVPTYQERSVSGWAAYSRPYYYGYNGGPYAHASHHYYDGANLHGPAVYSYRWRHHHRARYHRTNYHQHLRGVKPRTHYYYTG